ncbi:MAG: DUF692 domain-containing protein [Pseudomonadota bacterium]|nr:DUF692 domain-containing protein [Pseudomonadota bacterium]
MSVTHPVPRSPKPDVVPPGAGVGLKAAHYGVILDAHPQIGFFEVHAENYMGAGGPPHRYLTAIRDDYPLSLHGVGLSIGSDGPLDGAHLRRVAALVRRYEPGLFSEHLAWSSHGGTFFNDLLPVPYTARTLQRVCEHLDQVQETLGRQILLENPSTYVAFAQSTYAEPDFIAEVARRSGCALLLDVNNVHVACTNQQCDPHRYLAHFPLEHVRQIHLAGYATDADERGRPLLIDAHDREVAEEVWALYGHVLARLGAVPTLIEWDQNVPQWAALAAQAERADRALRAAAPSQETRRVALG